ncbi:hypothetical protein A6A20_05895 [Volucribacter amazonae]|uniref:Uncharacterized protein n=1 Tax=Volucribacter amazonae TaxID=256731 RepID=A0A9X4PBE3_9PAST|nr:hypothetical protein [Volucribacter amazonae]
MRGKIEQAHQGGINAEAAVFSHLLTFFSRYYEDGDFISQRRYKGDTYAIPYSGEEVMLHWANKDQYYTKSGEHFSNYRFKLDDEREVYFRLVSADVARDNRKDNDGKRLFVLATERSAQRADEDGEIIEESIVPFKISDDGKTLEVFFEYQLFGKGEKQETYNQQTLATLQTCLPPPIQDFPINGKPFGKKTLPRKIPTALYWKSI